MKNATEVKSAYDSGTLSVPCVVLKCIGFNKSLFNDLVKLNGASTPSSSNARGTKQCRSESDEGLEGARGKRARQ